MDFKLDLNGVTYNGRCISTKIEKGKETKSWSVTAEFNKFGFTINIPQEKNASEEEVMVFIMAFHKAFQKVRQEQRENNDLKWLNN